MSDFALLSQLGRGSTSVVYRCRHLPTATDFALKCIPVAGDESRRQAYLREIAALQASCSGMISCQGCFIHEDSLYLVLQLMEGGSLEGLLRARGVLPERVACALAYQLFWCLARLRNAHLLHRDVKPSNVLLSLQGAVRLGDAGLAREGSSVAQEHSFVGTFLYMAPERLQQEPYAFPADVYGVGLCIVQAVLGRFPLSEEGSSYVDTLMALLEAPPFTFPPNGTPLAGAAAAAGGGGGGEKAPAAALYLSPSFRELFEACVSRQPAQRPTAEAALLSPLFAANGITDRHASEEVLRVFLGGPKVPSPDPSKLLELI
jgi:serine/threonine protein kinase